ncbi:flippase [Halobacterium wangiae]|uniref:flippase n=1 Tax=Halobacterium wangiae TaxID=2902623 RepID=UPI001E2D2BD0|nr:flippase [Halobacterium wangiae]
MTLAERLSRGAKATFGGNLVGMLSNAALIVLLTRVFLTPEEFGELNFVLSAVGVLAIFATLGLPKSAARYVTEFTETAPKQVPHVVRRSVVYLAALVAVVSGGTLVLGRPVANLIGVPSLVPYLLVAALYVAVSAFSSFFGSLFQGFNRVTWTAATRIITRVGQLVFVVAFIMLGYGVVGALFGYIAGLAVSTVFGGYVVYTRFYSTYERADEPAERLSRRLLEYSIPLTATRGANVLDKKVDTILVGVLLNMTAVGYYTLAKQVSNFVAMPAASFGFTLSPALGEQKNKQNVERASRLYEQSLEYVLLAYVPAVVGLALVADPMVRYIFGTDYLGAVPVVQVFGGFILVNAVNKITSDGLDYLGRARSRAIVKTVMSVSNFGLNLLLIPIIGVVGAAIATVLTYTVYTLSNVYFIHQELTIRIPRVARRLGIICLVTAGMALAVLVVLPYVSGILSLLAAVLLGAATWASLSIAGGVLDVQKVTNFLA